jgi:hypothetical protein
MDTDRDKFKREDAADGNLNDDNQQEMDDLPFISTNDLVRESRKLADAFFRDHDQEQDDAYYRGNSNEDVAGKNETK